MPGRTVVFFGPEVFALGRKGRAADRPVYLQKVKPGFIFHPVGCLPQRGQKDPHDSYRTQHTGKEEDVFDHGLGVDLPLTVLWLLGYEWYPYSPWFPELFSCPESDPESARPPGSALPLPKMILHHP